MHQGVQHVECARMGLTPQLGNSAQRNREAWPNDTVLCEGAWRTLWHTQAIFSSMLKGSGAPRVQC